MDQRPPACQVSPPSALRHSRTSSPLCRTAYTVRGSARSRRPVKQRIGARPGLRQVTVGVRPGGAVVRAAPKVARGLRVEQSCDAARQGLHAQHRLAAQGQRLADGACDQAMGKANSGDKKTSVATISCRPRWRYQGAG